MVDVGKKGFFHIMVGNTLVKVIGFLSSVIVARILTKAELGLISYVDNIYSYFALFAGMGVSSAVLRYCAMPDTSSRKLGYFYFSIKFGLAFQLLVICAISIIASVFKFPFERTREFIFMLIIYPAFYFLYELSVCYIRAEMQFKKYSLITISYSALLVALTICLTPFMNLYGIISARYITIAACLSAAYFIITKLIKADCGTSGAVDKSITSKQKKEFLSYSASNMFAVAISTMIPLNEMFLINNILKDSTASADFRIAIAIPGNLLFITSSILLFAFPYYVKRQQDHKWVWKSSFMLCIGLIAFFLTSGLIYAIFSKAIISLLFGVKYAYVSSLSAQLFCVYSINASFRMLALNILLALGEAKFNAKMAVLSFVSQIALDSIFISRFGIYGAVYGIAIVYLFTGFLYWRKLYALTHVKI